MRRSIAMLICFMLLVGTTMAEAILGDTHFVMETKTPDATPAAETPAPDGPIEILITAAGDVTLGGNMRKNPKSNFYTEVIDEHPEGLGFLFEKALPIFGADDLTLVNFEGTLTTRTKHKDNEFVFRAPAEHVEALKLGSIEAVSLENNHIMDFYQEGFDDTVAAIDAAGIVRASDGLMGLYAVKGVRIGMLSYQTFDRYDRLFQQVPSDIEAARPLCDILIVSFHWGAEKDYAPNANQIKMGRLAIDSGADLVLGHHSHRINPIERYNGKYIVYSLGNCSFSGNSKPSDMDTFLFQQKFTFDGTMATPGDFRIIPASISSATAETGKKTGKNDLSVTPFPVGSAGIDRVIEVMTENGKSLEYAVSEYPTEWP